MGLIGYDVSLMAREGPSQRPAISKPSHHQCLIPRASVLAPRLVKGPLSIKIGHEFLENEVGSSLDVTFQRSQHRSMIPKLPLA